MKIILVSKCSLDIEQNFEFKMLVLISPSKSLIRSRWVTFCNGYLRLPNFDLLIISLSVKTILADDPYVVPFKRLPSPL